MVGEGGLGDCEQAGGESKGERWYAIRREIEDDNRARDGVNEIGNGDI